MSQQLEALRQQVLRRVRYATNTHALLDDRVPPEGPFDAALTNGLLAIVADEWPGSETRKDGQLKSARELLAVLDAHGCPFPYVDVPVLRDGLDVSQPIRHGRAHDEFAIVLRSHIDALAALDAHPLLRFLERSQGKSVDWCLWAAFTERAEWELPFDPKDRLDVPEPEPCDECWRPTFLRPAGTCSAAPSPPASASPAATPAATTPPTTRPSPKRSAAPSPPPTDQGRRGRRTMRSVHPAR
jgi:hypothetical protein